MSGILSRLFSHARTKESASRFSHRALYRSKLWLNRLEERDVPAQIHVTNSLDSGAGSLRDQVGAAAAGDEIVFDMGAGLVTSPINLTSGQITISKNITVTGPGATTLTIANSALVSATSRIFNVTATGAVGISQLTLTGGNVNTGGSGNGGGAIVNTTTGAITLTKCVLTGNTAAGASEGGAISNNSTGPLTINNCVLSNNIASGTGDGGAINNQSSGAITIVDSLITGNTCVGPSTDGGAIYLNASAAVFKMSGTTMSANTASGASGRGGAIYFTGGGNATIRNSTISGNAASGATNGRGGAFFFTATGSTIQNSTIANNTSAFVGGGIYGPVGTLESTIVANNTGSSALQVSGTITNANYSLITSTATITNNKGTSAPGTDPALAALANNGGFTLPNGTTIQTRAIVAGSSAVNAGSNPAPAATFDQRGTGFPRTQGAKTDIGAFELPDGSPSASATGPTIVTATSADETITVTYTISSGTIKASTLDDNDITVTGPGGYSKAGHLIGGPYSNGASIVAQYTVPANPAGTSATQFDAADNGAYTITLNAGQVTDSTGAFGNSVNAIGSFSVAIPTTYIVDEVSDVDDADFSAGKLSLREAIGRANADSAPSVINFSSAFATAKTISVAIAMPITEPVTINAPAGRLTLDGTGGGSRAFSIDLTTGGGAVSMAGMTLTGFSVTGDGGAIDDQDAALTLTGMVLTGNVATTNGGAVNLELAGSSLTVTNSVISLNTATSGDGGGIFATVSMTMTITNSVISDNAAASTAGDAGGIMLLLASTLNMSNSTVSGNTANHNSALFGGGGIYANDASTVNITNSTVSGNTSAGGGGGIQVDDAGTLNLVNSTVANNAAAFGGGGINLRLTGGVANLISSIVAGNSGATGPDILGVSGSTVNADSSNISNSAGITTLNQTGTNLIDVDPLLDALANNGGFVLPDGSTIQTHALQATSPAIDAGSNTLSLTYDQRGVGFSRVSGGKTDMGAFEVQGAASPAKVTFVQVNFGATQRSEVTSITVNFDSVVGYVGSPTAAFVLNRTGPSGTTGAVTLTVLNQISNSITFGFANGGPIVLDGTSLPDGQYQLSTVDGQITSAGGNLDGDGNGTAGGVFSTPTPTAAGYIYRLFGDANGDHKVDAIDFGLFRTSFNQASPSPNYNSAFDFNNDGKVDAIDFGAFRSRFNTTM